MNSSIQDQWSTNLGMVCNMIWLSLFFMNNVKGWLHPVSIFYKLIQFLLSAKIIQKSLFAVEICCKIDFWHIFLYRALTGQWLLCVLSPMQYVMFVPSLCNLVIVTAAIKTNTIDIKIKLYSPFDSMVIILIKKIKNCGVETCV